MTELFFLFIRLSDASQKNLISFQLRVSKILINTHHPDPTTIEEGWNKSVKLRSVGYASKLKVMVFKLVHTLTTTCLILLT